MDLFEQGRSRLGTLTPSEAVLWRPQARQAAALAVCGFGDALRTGDLHAPLAPLIGYGGAAGGGKTDFDLGLAAIAMVAVPGIHVAFFRREFTDLESSESAIERSWQIIGSIPGATYNTMHHRWRLDNGSSLQFCHCAHEHDKYGYKSAQFDILIIDEATSFTWSIINFLLTRNRATVAAWPGHTTAYAFAVMTSNPGDVGHAWYRQVFVDAAVHDAVCRVETPDGENEDIVFLPARLEDNPILLERDPDYERKLEARGGPLGRAMRWGDWDVAGGLFFAQHWRSNPINGKPAHIIEEFEVPHHWPLFGSVDYGFATNREGEKPFVYGLYTADELGHLYRIDELAAAGWDPLDQITRIKELEARYGTGRVRYRVGCPSMFIPRSASGPTIAEEYGRAGIPVVRPNTDRINGWARCILWLRDAPDGLPYFMSFRRCTHFNRQIPSLPTADGRDDDIDDAAEDHAAEEWRHFLMSRPSPATVPMRRPERGSAEEIFNAISSATRF